MVKDLDSHLRGLRFNPCLVLYILGQGVLPKFVPLDIGQLNRYLVFGLTVTL